MAVLRRVDARLLDGGLLVGFVGIMGIVRFERGVRLERDGGRDGLTRHYVLDMDEEDATVLCKASDGDETEAAAKETGLREGVGYVHEV